MVENIKGSSINLTASPHAWDVQSKKSVVDGKKINIPAKGTVSIFTREAVWVSRRIGGSYHPRVSLVAKGLSNISTTLDPQWYGLSLVTVTNYSEKPITIRVGEAFVSVMFYYLKTPATKGIIDNQASRPDLYSKFILEDRDEEFLGEQWHRNYHGIMEHMKESDSYNYLLKDKNKFRRNVWDFFNHNFISVVIGGVLLFILQLVISHFGILGK